MRVLEIGVGKPDRKANSPEALFKDVPDVVIETMDADNTYKPTYWHDIMQPIPEELKGQFDIVFASHILEHIPRNQVLDSAYNMVELTKLYGELYILVPSLEWVSMEVLANRETAALQGALYGAQTDEYEFHKSAFTLNWLRIIFENVLGLVIRKSYQSRYGMLINGQAFPAFQNVLIVWKQKEVSRQPIEDDENGKIE